MGCQPKVPMGCHPLISVSENGTVSAQMPRTHRSKGSKRNPTTKIEYEKMVDAHRADLGAHQKASDAAGVSYRTALRAFQNGLGKDKPAIRTLMSREMVEARASLQRHKDTDAESRDTLALAAKDMVDSRAMQARSLRMARNNAVAGMGMGSNLLRAGIQLSARVETLMSDKDWKPSPGEAIKLLKAVVETNKMAIEMANISEEMERRILGQPDIIVAHTDMTVNQAVVVLQEGARTVDRLRRRAARGDLPEGVSSAVIDTTAKESAEKPKP